MFGDPSTTPGGRALKFYSSVRLKIHKKATIKDDKNIEGILTHAFLQKSKVGPPLRKTGEHTIGYIPIYFDGRIVDDFDSIIASAIELGIIENPKGITYTYKDIKIVGKKNVKDAMMSYKDEITELVRAKAGSIKVSDDFIAEDDDDDEDDFPDIS
jgi:recombination protein RecA